MKRRTSRKLRSNRRRHATPPWARIRKNSRRRSSLRRNGSYFFQGRPAEAEQKIHQIRSAGGSDVKATKRYDGIWTVTFNADPAVEKALFGSSSAYRASGYGIGTPMEMNSRRRRTSRKLRSNSRRRRTSRR